MAEYIADQAFERIVTMDVKGENLALFVRHATEMMAMSRDARDYVLDLIAK